MEKLLPVTDKSALRLGVSVGQFLGEAESNIEFEQVFGWGRDRALGGLLEGGFTPVHCQDPALAVDQELVVSIQNFCGLLVHV